MLRSFAYCWLAALAPPGSDGVLFLPTLSGSTAPRWNSDMRGCFAGLAMSHDAAHMARAVLEGCAYALRDIVDRFAALGSPATRSASSAAARAPRCGCRSRPTSRVARCARCWAMRRRARAPRCSPASPPAPSPTSTRPPSAPSSSPPSRSPATASTADVYAETPTRPTGGCSTASRERWHELALPSAPDVARDLAALRAPPRAVRRGRAAPARARRRAARRRRARPASPTSSPSCAARRRRRAARRPRPMAGARGEVKATRRGRARAAGAAVRQVRVGDETADVHADARDARRGGRATRRRRRRGERRLGHGGRHRQGGQRAARRRPARRRPDRGERQRLRRRPVGAARRRRQAHDADALAGAAGDRQRRDRARARGAQPRRARRPAGRPTRRPPTGGWRGWSGRTTATRRSRSRSRARTWTPCSTAPTGIHRGEPDGAREPGRRADAQRHLDGRRRAHRAVLGDGAHRQPPARDGRARRRARPLHGAKVGVADGARGDCCGRACATVARGGGLRAALPDAEPRWSRACARRSPSSTRRAGGRGVLARLLAQARALARRARRRSRAAAAALAGVRRRAGRLLASPERLVGALRAARAPVRLTQLGVRDSTARWAVANGHLMRDRFTVADLAFFMGIWDDRGRRRAAGRPLHDWEPACDRVRLHAHARRRDGRRMRSRCCLAARFRAALCRLQGHRASPESAAAK